MVCLSNLTPVWAMEKLSALWKAFVLPEHANQELVLYQIIGEQQSSPHASFSAEKNATQ